MLSPADLAAALTQARGSSAQGIVDHLAATAGPADAGALRDDVAVVALRAKLG